MVSQIAFLRSNQNDLESCIRKQDEVEKLIFRVLENSTLTNIPYHNSVGGIDTSLVNVHPNESDLTILNDCSVSSKSSCLTQDQNIASNQDLTLQSEIQHLTQPVHDIYTDLSLDSVHDQSSISSANPPLSSSAQTTKGKEVLADSSHGKMIFNPETQNKSSKDHEPSKDDETKTSPSRKLAKAIKQLVPKRLTPRPFLERRGFCKKGLSCDFLHNQPPPCKVIQCPPQNSMNYTAFPHSLQQNFKYPRDFPPF